MERFNICVLQTLVAGVVGSGAVCSGNRHDLQPCHRLLRRDGLPGGAGDA